MKFKQYRIQLEQKHIMILEPLEPPPQLWFVEPLTHSRCILANAEGFAFMRDLLLIASQHSADNILFYVPRERGDVHTPVMAAPEMREWYKVGEFDLNLVLFPFHHLHIRPKDAKRVIHSLRYLPQSITHLKPDPEALRVYKESRQYWQRLNSLNTKAYAKMFILSADRNTFLQLACEADDFTSIEDDARRNFIAHAHADHIGTNPDNGLNFFYYYQQLK